MSNKTNTKSKSEYVINGLIIGGLGFLLWTIVAPQFKSCNCRNYSNDVREALLGIYNSCTTQWRDNGPESVCYKFGKSYYREKGVEIATLGNKSNFIAYAVHTRDSLVYKMTLTDYHNRQPQLATGSYTEKELNKRRPHDIRLATGPFTQKKFNEIGLNISNAKRDLIHLILACSAYWEKNGNDNNCTPEVATKTTFRYSMGVSNDNVDESDGRYIQSPDVVISAQGYKSNFTAQAEGKEDGRMFKCKSRDYTTFKIKEVFPWSWIFFWE